MVKTIGVLFMAQQNFSPLLLFRRFQLVAKGRLRQKKCINGPGNTTFLCNCFDHL